MVLPVRNTVVAPCSLNRCRPVGNWLSWKQSDVNTPDGQLVPPEWSPDTSSSAPRQHCGGDTETESPAAQNQTSSLPFSCCSFHSQRNPALEARRERSDKAPRGCSPVQAPYPIATDVACVPWPSERQSNGACAATGYFLSNRRASAHNQQNAHNHGCEHHTKRHDPHSLFAPAVRDLAVSGLIILSPSTGHRPRAAPDP